MATGIGARVELQGAADFTSTIKLLKAQVQNFQSQMKELSSQFSGTGKSADELKKRNELLGQAIDKQASLTGTLSKEIDSQKAKLTQLANAVQTAQGEYSKSIQKVAEATSKYGDNSKEVAQATEEQNKNREALREASNAYSNQATAVERLEKQYNVAQAQTNKFSSELEKNEKTIQDIERGYNDAGNQVDQFGKEVKEAEKGVKDIGSTGPDSVGKLTAAFAAAELAADLVKKAISTITNSLSSAVSRFDTLNNFPKILQQMGYSAEDASDATQRLSDGVQGLPTALDDVVSTAQRLTAVTGDLDKATDTTIALNNAFIASGSDTAAASRGLDQYINMLSRGEVTQQRWQTLQETMGYALTQTAQAFGFAGESAQNDLYDALKAGDITFDQFNAKVIELNDGVGGFAEVALTAAGGIKTAWTNVGTAITRNLANTITVVNDALADTRFGSIEGVFNSIKLAINDTFNSVNAALPGILSKVISVYDAIEPFIPLIVGVTSALVAFGVAMKIQETIQGATKAFQLFNAAIAANPIGAVIAAIAGLVAGILYLWNTNEDFRNGVIAIWESIQQAVLVFVESMEVFFTEVLPAVFGAFTNFLRIIFEKDWSESFGGLGDILNAFFANVKNIGGSIKDVFSGISDFVKNIFAGNWRAAWQSIVDIFRSVFGLLANVAKVPLNAIIGFLNAAISGINTLIEGINKIKFDVPDWVPLLGGKKFGFNIPSIGKIPHLAKGAVIAPGKEFLAVLGDQTRGYNIETPESLMRQVVREEAGGANVTLNITINASGREDETFIRKWAKQIADVAETEIANRTQRRAAARGG